MALSQNQESVETSTTRGKTTENLQDDTNEVEKLKEQVNRLQGLGVQLQC